MTNIMYGLGLLSVISLGFALLAGLADVGEMILKRYKED